MAVIKQTLEISITSIDLKVIDKLTGMPSYPYILIAIDSNTKIIKYSHVVIVKNVIEIPKHMAKFVTDVRKHEFLQNTSQPGRNTIKRVFRKIHNEFKSRAEINDSPVLSVSHREDDR